MAPPPPPEQRPTRRAILDAIKRQVKLTVPVLAEKIGVTPMAIRQHLNALEADGLVTARPRKQKMGRPRRVYSLTDAARRLFPAAYDELALSVLDAIAATDGPEKVDEVFAARRQALKKLYARRLGGKPLPARRGAGASSVVARRAIGALPRGVRAQSCQRPLAEKVRLLAQLCDEAGYMCSAGPASDRSEPSAPAGADADGFLLVEHHCPIHAVAQKYRSVCRHEIELFREVLAEEGVSIERLEHIVSGGHHCKYLIKPEKATPV